METTRNTESYHRPSRFALLVSSNPHRAQQLTTQITECDCDVDSVNWPAAMTARGGYQHYDLIVVDLDDERQLLLESVEEIRRLHNERGQPPTPILGISSGDDALADLAAIELGCTDVMRCAPHDPQVQRSLNKYLDSALMTA